MARLYLETLQRTGADAFAILEKEKVDLDEIWTMGISDHRGRTPLRRRYVAGIKRLEELWVALGGEPGRFEPLDADTRPLRMDGPR